MLINASQKGPTKISSPHDGDTAIDQTAGLGILTTESCQFVFQPVGET
jgi:hypothetical protein